MQPAARLLLRYAESTGWYIVVNTEFTTRSAIAAWEAVQAAGDNVHVGFFDRYNWLGSVLLSLDGAAIIGHTRRGVVAVIVDRIIKALR